MKHKHHIIPKHMGGTDCPDNIISLTVEQHAEAHKILYETHGLIGDYLAWKGLSGQLSKIEIIKAIYKENGRRTGLKMKGRTPPNKGVPMTEEQKEKLRGPKTEKHKQAMRKPKSTTEKMGKHERTPEMREAFSKQRKELLSTPEMRKKMSDAAKKSRGSCQFCGREMNKANIARHELPCKNNPINA